MNRTLRMAGTAGLLILSAYFISACAVTLPPSIQPITSSPEGIRFLQDRYAETVPYRGLLTIRPMTRKAGGVSLDAVLRVDAADHLRLQGLSPMGGVLFSLELEEERFHLRLQDRGSVSGPLEMLDRLYGHLLPLKASQLMAILTPYGDSPEGPKGVFYFQDEPGYYRLSKLRLSPTVQGDPAGSAGWAFPLKSWFIEKGTGHLAKMEIHDESSDRPGRKVLSVEYRDYRPAAGASGIQMPYRMVVKGSDGDPWVELNFQEIHLGREGDADPGT